LGAERKDVEVEVLDEGKRNLFRFASKQARIKLTILDASVEANKSAETEEKIATVENDEDLSFEEMFEAETNSNMHEPVNLDLTDVEEVVKETVLELLEKWMFRLELVSRRSTRKMKNGK